jgi:hypothetical protein
LLRTEIAGQFVLSPGAPASQAWRSLGSESFCQAVLDVNSVAEYGGTLHANQLEGLLREFSTMAEEIVEKGDIP